MTKMQANIVIIMVVALTATTNCLAAPTINQADTLKRPSPINPAIPMDPKPADKITVITDPKELAKIKREIKNDTPVYTITAPTTIQPQKQSTEGTPQNYEHKSSSNADEQAKHRQKRAETLETSTHPLINRDQHKQQVQFKQTTEAGISATPQTLAAPIPPPEHQLHSKSLPTQHEKSEKSPNCFDAGKRSDMKRDIPVPLVPKYHHPEESPKNHEKSDDVLKNENSKNDHSLTSSTQATSTSKISSTTSSSTNHH